MGSMSRPASYGALAGLFDQQAVVFVSGIDALQHKINQAILLLWRMLLRGIVTRPLAL